VRRAVRAALPALGVALALAAAAFGAPRPDGPPTGDELAELSKPPVRTSIASQRIYFVMTDRYANGDPSNDRGGRTGAREVTGYDPTDPGWFHGGDFRGLAAGCERIKQLGFTAIWVTPPFGQKSVQGNSAAYHGYWGVDFTHVDPHLGADADFAAFVDCAHRNGMKVILDVVPNHTADVIQLSSTAFVAPPAPPHTATVPAAERDLKRPSWLNDPADYHNRGNMPSSCDQTCAELGDFFGLDDLATELPAVRTGLVEIYADWIRRYRVDGFRVDTARHVDAGFFPFWVPRMLAAAREAGVADFEIFGEAFVRDAVQLSTFVRDRGLPNALDFPLQDPLVRFAAGRGNGAAIASRLADDDYFALNTGVVHTPPTFLGNHDIGRAALNILAVGPDAGGLLKRVLLGYDLLYLLRGAPVVYYGDEVGILGSGGDKAARQDLFPTQVREWQTDPRVGGGPIGTRSSLEITNHPIANRLRALAALRDRYPVFAAGATHVRFASRRVLALSRIDMNGRREYVTVFNSRPRSAKVTLHVSTPDSTWARLLGIGGRGRSSMLGSLTVRVPAVSTLVLRAEHPLPIRRPTVSINAATDNISGLVRLTATVGRGGPTSVAFALRRPGRPWQRIAVDDSPPYRAFLERSTDGDLVAVARALDGAVAVSPVITLKGRP
jgi:glycosidase